MKKVLLFLIIILSFGCKTKEIIVEVEKQVVKSEYKTNVHRDSIYLKDSIYILDRGDTVWVNSYKYIYRDKLRADTILKTDTIRSVETTIKEVNILTPVQQLKNKAFWWFVSIIVFLLIWVFRKPLIRFVRFLLKI